MPLRVAVNVEDVVCAARAAPRAVPVRVAEAALVRFEVLNVFVDEGPSLESGHPGLNEAAFRIRRRESDGRAHEISAG
jgi:hypothetical protein